MTTELTPAVQDAAHNLGWRLAAAGMTVEQFFDGYNEQRLAIDTTVASGMNAFTPEAEAERVEAVREAGARQERIDNTLMRGLHALHMDDTQGQVPEGDSRDYPPLVWDVGEKVWVIRQAGQ